MSPSAPMPRTVLFDLGGVLVDWDPRYLYRKLFDDEAEMEWFLSEICTPAWNASMDAGRPFDDGVAELVAKHPERRAPIEAYRDRWPEMLAGAITDTVEVLERLDAADVPLFALTNWSAETFPVAVDRFDFLKRFRKIVVSGEVGLKKPDPAIFHLLLDEIGVEAEAVLFIDDQPANVDAASRLGFATHRFESAAQLAKDARIQGLLSRP